MAFFRTPRWPWFQFQFQQNILRSVALIHTLGKIDAEIERRRELSFGPEAEDSMDAWDDLTAYEWLRDQAMAGLQHANDVVFYQWNLRRRMEDAIRVRPFEPGLRRTWLSVSDGADAWPRMLEATQQLLEKLNWEKEEETTIETIDLIFSSELFQ
jgi:hypothetical protein